MTRPFTLPNYLTREERERIEVMQALLSFLQLRHLEQQVLFLILEWLSAALAVTVQLGAVYGPSAGPLRINLRFTVRVSMMVEQQQQATPEVVNPSTPEEPVDTLDSSAPAAALPEDGVSESQQPLMPPEASNLPMTDMSEPD